MRDTRIYIYIIDLEAEFYFQSGVSTRIASCSPECLHILKYLASHRPAGTSKYIHTAVLVSICGNSECTEARTRGRHRKTGHRTFSTTSFHFSLLLAPPLSRLYFTFMRWRARIVRGFFHRVKRALYASNKPPAFSFFVNAASMHTVHSHYA